MKIYNLFPTTIYENYYEGDLTPYIDKCMKLKDKIKCGGDGWLNRPYNTHNTYNLYKDKFFKKLIDFFNKNVETFSKEIGAKEVSIKTGCGWFNVSNKGDSQEFHDHNFNIISGIFYLKSSENDASTVFKSPIGELPSDKHNENNFYNRRSYRIQPVQGKLLLFRSNIEHCVERQMIDSNRITIAVNYK